MALNMNLSFDPAPDCPHCTPEPLTFTIHTLPADLREKAIERERDHALSDYYWAEYSTDDYVEILEMLGFSLDYREVRLMNGKTRREPEISYRVSYCQGDGTGFSADWCPHRDPMRILTDVMSHAPVDDTLHSIAFDLALLTENAEFYYNEYAMYEARIDGSGRYPSSRVNVDLTMPEHVTYLEDELDPFVFQTVRASIVSLGLDRIEDELQAIVQRLDSWFYTQLTNEIEHLTSEETILETLAQYEFDEDGDII